MAEYAQFKIGGDGFDIVQFTPALTDIARTNYQGVQCLYRSGAWYVQKGGAKPSDRALGSLWGIPDEAVAAAPDVPATAYPDGNPKSLQGAKKYSLRYLPLPAAVEVNRALEDGAKKYGAANWRKTGVAASVYVDAALRHLAQWYDGGQKNAADSGVHNLGHAMACLAILIDAESCGKLVDDRPEPCPDTDEVLLR